MNITESIRNKIRDFLKITENNKIRDDMYHHQ